MTRARRPALTSNPIEATDASIETRARVIVELVVVGAAALFVMWRLRPSLLLADTLPAGGDLSSHNWGPDALRRTILPGPWAWSWDWFAGFPAYHFYPPLPALAVAVVDQLVPYGVAMKLVVASGPALLPVTAWTFARCWALPFPTAPLAAVGSVAFLFDSTGPFGGSLRSAIAGEYSYGIGLALAVLALALLAPVVRGGRWRTGAAVALAGAALAHPLAGIFAAIATTMIVVVHVGRGWREVARRLAPVAMVAGALAGIWWIPFLLRRGYMTSPDLPRGEGVANLLPFAWAEPLLFALAIAGVVLGWRAGRRIVGALALTALAAMFLYLVLPLGQLQNTRLLPFWSWCRLTLAAVGIAEIMLLLCARGTLRDGALRARWLLATPVIALFVAVMAIAWAWHLPPFGVEGEYSVDANIEVAFEGYERNPQYPEYRLLMDTMAKLGRERGCGRFSWSTDVTTTDFGTVSNDLAPYWTDGCITSLHGLYYDSSATTPFISLTESLTAIAPLGFAPGVPYRGFDLDEGVRHLRYSGVRYFAARTRHVVDAADAHRGLERVAQTEGWVVYEVNGSRLVEPLGREPLVLAAGSWDEASVRWTEQTDRWDDVLLAAHGPANWRRFRVGRSVVDRALPAVQVAAVQLGDHSLSFRVDRIGVPVLVKASYFPTWTVDGGDGPYRVAGNMMVVVPRAHEVHLVQTRRATDWLALLSFGLGIVGAVALFVHDRRQRSLESSLP